MSNVRSLALAAVIVGLLGGPALAANGPDEDEPQATYATHIVVTASRKAEEIRNAPVSVSVVTDDEIANAAEVELGDLLRRVPGLNVSQLSAMDWKMNARGANPVSSRNSLALVDGRRIYEDSLAVVFWSLVPVEPGELKQAEVIRGPGSAVWGANAYSGVTNLVTQTPRELEGTRIRVRGGEVGTFGVSLIHAGVADEVSYKVSASHSRQDEWQRDDQFADGTPLPAGSSFENDGTKQTKVDGRVDIDRADGGLLSVSGGVGVSEGIKHTPSGPFRMTDFYQGYGSATYTQEQLALSAHYTRFNVDAEQLFSGVATPASSNVMSLEGQNGTVLGTKHVVLYGSNLRYTHFRQEAIADKHHRWEAGGFVQDEIFISDKVAAHLGLRFDWIEEIGGSFAPRASLRVRPHEDHTFRFTYNRSYLAPSTSENFIDVVLGIPLDLGGELFISPFLGLGDPNLKVQTLDAFELAYIATLADRATLTAAVYHNESRDLIRFLPTAFYGPGDPPPGWPLPPAFVPPLPSVFEFVNTGTIIDKGLELSLDLALSQELTAFANYAFQADPDVDDEGSVLPLDTNIPPRHMVNAGLAIDRGRYFGSLTVNWTDEAFWADVLDASFHGTTDSFFMVNAAAGVRMNGGIGLAVRATNLTDEEIKQHVFGDVIRRRVLGEVSYTFKP